MKKRWRLRPASLESSLEERASTFTTQVFVSQDRRSNVRMEADLARLPQQKIYRNPDLDKINDTQSQVFITLLHMSCLDCNRGSILEGDPTGSFTEIDGVRAYLASNNDDATPRQGRRAIILFSDGFGLPLVNSHLLADKFSTELSCDVWIPDLFNGQPLLDLNGLAEALLPKRPRTWRLWDKIKFIFMILLPRIRVFVRNRASVVDPRIVAFIKKVREQQKYKKVGAVGYCFGGALGVRLASLNIFDSLVVCHPGSVSKAELKAINVPTSWVCAEEDMTFGPAIRNKAEALFAARKGKDDFVDYEFVDYKGTVHGFGTRPHLEFPDNKDAFEKSINQILKWFEKTLQVTSESTET